MLRILPQVHPILAAAVVSLTSAHAAVLATTNFDSTTKSAGSQTMTNILWTGDDLVLVTATTSVTTVASNNAGYFTTNFGATGFAPDQNIENEGPWTATFELTLNSATGSLSSISFDYAALSNSGASQGTNFRAQNFDIAINGTTYDLQRKTTAVNGSLIFTDTATLNNGSNLITITSSRGTSTAGYNMGIDNLSFDGSVTAVPEPSSLILLGLSSLSLLRRRRI